MANAKEIAAGVGQASDEELVELASDKRSTVSEAAKKEQDRRAAAAAEAAAADPPNDAAADPAAGDPPADDAGDTPDPDPEEIPEADTYDLVGSDGRRILRGHSRSSCEETASRIKAATGEKLKIKPSS